MCKQEVQVRSDSLFVFSFFIRKEYYEILERRE
jgi:hypothetical protein